MLLVSLMRDLCVDADLQVCNKMAKSQNNASRDCEAVRTQPTGSQSRADIVVDLYCGLGLWVCGTALSSTQLALQPERSENVILARWQEVSTMTAGSEEERLKQTRLSYHLWVSCQA